MMKTSVGVLIATVAVLFSPPLWSQESTGAAPEHPFLTDDWLFTVGYFWPDKQLDLAVDGTLPGPEIDFGEATRIDGTDSTWAGSARWNFGEKWSVWLQYWGLSNTESVTLEEDVEWRDLVFREGSFVTAGFDLDVARVFFGRELMNKPGQELGVGAGFHWMEIGAFIEGEVEINEDTTGFQRGAASAEFPMPNIGAWYYYSWSPKWLISARADWLHVSIDKYSGGMWGVQAGIQYQLFEHFGIELSYLRFELDGDVDDTDWRGSLHYQADGPTLSLTTNW